MPKPHSDPLNTQVTPEPALEKRTRRQFKPEYKLRILAAADACQHQIFQYGCLLQKSGEFLSFDIPSSQIRWRVGCARAIWIVAHGEINR